MTDTSAPAPATDRRARRWPYAAAGLLAAALGLGVTELLAGLMNRSLTPVLGVGEAFIDRTPGWLKDLAVAWFGTADKDVLIGGVLVVFAALAAGIGVLAARNRPAGLLAAAGLGLVATLAVWSRPGATTADLLPAIAGSVAAVLALGWLVDRARAAVGTDAEVEVGASRPTERTYLTGDRRGFLRLVVLTGVVAAAAGGAGRWLGTRRRGVEASREEIVLPRALPAADPPGGADLGVAGAEPWRTPNPVFYRIDTALAVPLIRPDDWQLRVHGMVEREVVLDFDELVALGLIDRWVTLACVSNEVGGNLIGNALWTGVRVADLLGLAGPSADADAVQSRSHDGWTAGTPLDVLTDGRDALLAVAMNGEPLPVEHGYPVRIVVPGLYGYVSATKWVVDIEVSRFDRFAAYWTTRGWSERGPIKVSSRIDVPSRSTPLRAGPVPVAGVAWAQHRGIAAVEVRVDGGGWQQADMGNVPSADTWRQWVWEWDAGPGRHLLEVRATTEDGETQTSETRPPVPDGATGWHAVEVSVDAT